MAFQSQARVFSVDGYTSIIFLIDALNTNIVIKSEWCKCHGNRSVNVSIQFIVYF